MTCRVNFSKHSIAPETGSPDYTRTCLAQSLDFQIKANTDYSASLSFLGCPMHFTSSWVDERSSQYLIHLVTLTNSKSSNQYCTYKNIIKTKKHMCTKILTNLTIRNTKLILYNFETLGTCLLAVTLIFGEVNVVATKQNIFLKNSWFLYFSAFSAFYLYTQLSIVPSTPSDRIILRFYFSIAYI